MFVFMSPEHQNNLPGNRMVTWFPHSVHASCFAHKISRRNVNQQLHKYQHCNRQNRCSRISATKTMNIAATTFNTSTNTNNIITFTIKEKGIGTIKNQVYILKLIPPKYICILYYVILYCGHSVTIFISPSCVLARLVTNACLWLKFGYVGGHANRPLICFCM